jgi:hypothetical protein
LFSVTKSPGSAPLRAIELIDTTVVPEFVNVTVSPTDDPPTGVAGNTNLVGAIVSARAETPVPVKVTVCGDSAALSATLRVAVALPDFFGVNPTYTAQDLPTARLAPQLLISTKEFA